jgi:hypothetical protein
MRELNIGTKNFTKIIVKDAPGQGNACHVYSIIRSHTEGAGIQEDFGYISFQNGPIKEFGINGCHNEDLLAIVIDRLESFQKGSFACRENALALTKIQEAMHWLNHRTNDRIVRNVEGTNIL